MEILIALTSIIAITFGAKAVSRFLPFELCPICAGVAGTWFWVLAGIYAGRLSAEDWILVAALAMGGSVVGIAYLGEKRFEWAEKSIFYFKVPVIVGGFAFVYWALNNISLLSLGIEALLLTFLFFVYFVLPAIGLAREKNPEKVRELEEKLKSCC